MAGGVMARRGVRTGEYLEVMRRIWAEGPAEFHGQDYDVPAGWFAPRPVQRPGPPILLGGIARAALERAGRLADGWVTSSRTDLSRISEGISVVRAAAEKPAATRTRSGSSAAACSARASRRPCPKAAAGSC